MTATQSQRALADEMLDAAGEMAADSFDATETVRRWAARVAALRLSAGADGWTLELYRDRDGELGVWAKQEEGSRVWIARAAATCHETGESE